MYWTKIYLSFTLGRTPFLSHNYFFLDVSWLKLRFLWKRLYTYESFEAFFLVIYLSVHTKKSFRFLIKHINSFLPLFSLITCVLCASFNYFRCFLWNFFGNFRWFWRHFISKLKVELLVYVKVHKILLSCNIFPAKF